MFLADLKPAKPPLIVLVILVLVPRPIVRSVAAEKAVGLAWDLTYLSVATGKGFFEQTRDGGFMTSEA